MTDNLWPLHRFDDLVCDQCGWTCNSNVECLTYGDRCPQCEQSNPGDEGTMKEIRHDDQ